MIRYNKGTWLAVCYWWGGLNQWLFYPTLGYACFLAAVYFIKVSTGYFVVLTDVTIIEALKSMLSFLAFLLVFRLNQCMIRHGSGVRNAALLFSQLERLATDYCVCLQGANAGGTSEHQLHEYGTHAVSAKVNVIRLTLAYAVGLLLHFQLLDAAHDTLGVLDDHGLAQVVFLYRRLSSLLYEEEMDIVTRTLCVFPHATDNSETTFKCEVSRHRPFVPRRTPLIGNIDVFEDNSDSMTSAPVPKVLMSMLIHALMEPIDEPWGYSIRLWASFGRSVSVIIEEMCHLCTLIAKPTPLPYLQHCRGLLCLFALTYPLTFDASMGLALNILMPAVLWWCILGFETLSAMLENPLGNDPCDINLLEQVHQLEVAVEYAFEVTEVHRNPMKRALRRTYTLVNGLHQPKTPLFNGKYHRFHHYFKWTPLPSLLLREIVQIHGQVELLHLLNVRRIRSFFYDTFSCCLSRAKRPSDGYLEVNTREDTEAGGCEATAFCQSELLEDPVAFDHCLTFVGALRGAKDDAKEHGADVDLGRSKRRPSQCHRAWSSHASSTLGNHVASSLLEELIDMEEEVLEAKKLEESVEVEEKEEVPKATKAADVSDRAGVVDDGTGVKQYYIVTPDSNRTFKNEVKANKAMPSAVPCCPVSRNPNVSPEEDLHKSFLESRDSDL